MIGVNVLCGAAGLYTYFTAGFVHFVVSRVFVGLVVLAISIMPFVLGKMILLVPIKVLTPISSPSA